MKTVIILAGLPGSGKSTWADAWVATSREETSVVCPDDIRERFTGNASNQEHDRVIWDRIVPQQIKDNVAAYDTVIFDATQVTRQARAHSIKRAKSLGARVECHYFEPNLKVALERNQARSRKVPENVIRDMADRWQAPHVNEGFDSVYKIE